MAAPQKLQIFESRNSADLAARGMSAFRFSFFLALSGLLSAAAILEARSSIAEGNGQEQTEKKQWSNTFVMFGGFKWELMGHGFDSEDRTTFTIMKFVAPDGEAVYEEANVCRSVDGAARKLNKGVGRSLKVIERAPRVDKTGQVRGERVLLVSKVGKGNVDFFIVLWTDGPLLHSMYSSSLKDVLALEKAQNQ